MKMRKEYDDNYQCKVQCSQYLEVTLQEELVPCVEGVLVIPIINSRQLQSAYVDAARRGV